MHTLNLFAHCPVRSKAISKGVEWLQKHRPMVESWARDLKLELTDVQAAIDADLWTANPDQASAPAAVHAGSVALQQHAPAPGRFAGRVIAVTSLNPKPVRWARQAVCLQSWLDYGLDVLTVNTTAELQTLSLPERVTGVACDELSTIYDRPTQLITSLLRVGAATGMPILLINSDIQIHGDGELLDTALQQKDALTIGVRYNHPARLTRDRARREPYGLDVFLVQPDLVREVPDLPFAIGKPMWDYWLPHVARSCGRRLLWLGEPLLFHENHPLGWSQSEWHVGADIMQQQCGVDMIYGCAAFRRNL